MTAQSGHTIEMVDQPEPKVRENMGIGPVGVGDPNVVFVRKFRWTLSCPSSSEYWMQSVAFDWLTKRIKCSAFEVWLPPGVVPIIDWLENFAKHKKKPVVFTTWDGCGQELYSYEFEGLRLESNESSFDYSSSDVSTRTFTLSYDKVKVKVAKRVPKELKIECVVDNNPEAEADLKTLLGQIKEKVAEETEIDFLNDKMWIPAKA